MISAQHAKVENTKSYDDGTNINFYISSIKAKGIREYIQIGDKNDQTKFSNTF